MEPFGVKRRLTCILAADAVGYSKMMGEDESGTLRVLAAHRAVIDGIIAFHSGRIISTAGDSVLAEFGSAVDAVRCAVEIQEALKTRNDALPEDRRLHFRVGVNLGDVVVKGDDLLGDGVNVAARIESIAEPGGVCIASSVYDQITGKLDLGFVDIGEQNLKNISRPVRVYRIAGAGATVRSPSKTSAASRKLVPWIAAGVGVAGLAAFALAWQTGWLDARSSREAAEQAKAAAAAEQAKVQAAAAADQAKVQAAAAADQAQRQAQASADEAKRLAEAETALMRARAKAEADALRARAEVEAAGVRAKAQAEAAAARAQTENDKIRSAAEADKAKAEEARAQAEAKLAAMTARSARIAANRSAAATAGRYDGEWLATRELEAIEEAPAARDNMRITVRDGEFILEIGVPDRPRSARMSGRPAEDGTLLLRGTGISGLKGHLGQRFNIRFEGRCSGDRCVLAGKYGSRAGTITLTRAGA